ncbi:MAG: PorV/PorQ family protein [bacterium]
MSLILILPARAGILPDGAFSDEAAGTTSARFLKSAVGARRQAMAGAGLALGGADAVFANPAGLATMESERDASFSLSYERKLETAYRSAVSWARPLKGGGVLGAGALFLSQSAMESLSANGDVIGSFSPYDLALSASYARTFGTTAFGASLKGIRSELAGRSAASFALDAGLIMKNAMDLSGGLTDVAFSLRNLGPSMKLGSSSDPLPMELGLGMLWHIYRNMEMIMEGRMPVDHSPYAILGGEWALPMGFNCGGALRAGYSFRNSGELGAMGALTAGLGMVMGRFNFDYAWVPVGDLGTTHRITVGFRYGSSPKPYPSDKGKEAKVSNAKKKNLPGLVPKIVVAVSKISAKGISEDDLETAAGWVMDVFSKSKKFDVINREKKAELLREQAEQLALCSGDCEIRTGRMLGADKIVFGTLTKFEKGYVLRLEMIDVLTGKIEFSDSKAFLEYNEFKKVVSLMASAISEELK